MNFPAHIRIIGKTRDEDGGQPGKRSDGAMAPRPMSRFTPVISWTTRPL